MREPGGVDRPLSETVEGTGVETEPTRGSAGATVGHSTRTESTLRVQDDLSFYGNGGRGSSLSTSSKRGALCVLFGKRSLTDTRVAV